MALDTADNIRNEENKKKSFACCKGVYFLMLFSPLAWFHCFHLIFIRTRARSPRMALIYYNLLLFALLLIGLWTYLYYYVTMDGELYLQILSNAAANDTTVSEGREQFNYLIWRTILRTLFMALIFGILQVVNVFLASQWRQRLSDLLCDLLLR